MTNDQYTTLYQLLKWYRKYNKQFITISGTYGTGCWELIQEFIQHIGLEQDEVMYLSHNHYQILDLGYKLHHIYHFNSIVYDYYKKVNPDTLPFVSKYPVNIEYKWKRKRNKEIDKKYKLIIVMDSSLINFKNIEDLSKFNLPIILLSDPLLIPAQDSYLLNYSPEILLKDITPEYIDDPKTKLIRNIIEGNKLHYNDYGNIRIIPKRSFNKHLIRNHDMIITTNNFNEEFNKVYRQNILKQKSNLTAFHERVIVRVTIPDRVLINEVEDRIKVHLTRGLVGTLMKITRHIPTTKYINVSFRPDHYASDFDNLSLDRYYLNNLNLKSSQLIPEEIFFVDYAYALSVTDSRFMFWNKVIVLLENAIESNEDISRLYTAISRGRIVTLII